MLPKQGVQHVQASNIVVEKSRQTAETSVSEGERLLGKAEVCHRVGKTFPTIWEWMQKGKFPRARDNHGVPGWLDSEVSAWIRGLPLKPYKGDANASEANESSIRASEASVESRRRAAAKTRRDNVLKRARKTPPKKGEKLG